MFMDSILCRSHDFCIETGVTSTFILPYSKQHDYKIEAEDYTCMKYNTLYSILCHFCIKIFFFLFKFRTDIAQFINNKTVYSYKLCKWPSFYQKK